MSQFIDSEAVDADAPTQRRRKPALPPPPQQTGPRQSQLGIVRERGNGSVPSHLGTNTSEFAGRKPYRLKGVSMQDAKDAAGSDDGDGAAGLPEVYGPSRRQGQSRFNKASANPTRYWFGTYYPDQKEQEAYLSGGALPELRLDYQREDVTCWRGQWEYGGKGDKDGRLHAQFAVCFRDQCRAPQARRILGGEHGPFSGFLEPAFSKNVWDYVQKTETRVGQLPPYGNLSDDSGHRSDLDVVYAEISQGAPLWDIMSRFPRQFMRNHAAISKLCAMYDRPRPYQDCQVEVWWGITGSGKSYDAFHNFPEAYRKTIPGKWWEGYKGETSVVFEEYNPEEEKELRLPELLKILDKYPYQVEIKGASLQLRAHHFIFTTNIDPRTWYRGHPQQPALFRRISRVVVYRMGYVEAQRAGLSREDVTLEFGGLESLPGSEELLL